MEPSNGKARRTRHGGRRGNQAWTGRHVVMGPLRASCYLAACRLLTQQSGRRPSAHCLARQPVPRMRLTRCKLPGCMPSHRRGPRCGTCSGARFRGVGPVHVRPSPPTRMRRNGAAHSGLFGKPEPQNPGHRARSSHHFESQCRTWRDWRMPGPRCWGLPGLAGSRAASQVGAAGQLGWPGMQGLWTAPCAQTHSFLLSVCVHVCV